MALPMMTVSGIRGIVNETIDELFISRMAFIQTKQAGGGLVVVGRDTRPSGRRFCPGRFQGNLRASNTDPIIQCYTEARTAKQARQLADMVMTAAKSS